MHSDMRWGGSFHRHIMTSGGRTMTAARTVQFENEFKSPAIAAVETTEIQSMAMVALIGTTCMLQV
jgi:hypothetical protein